MKAPQWKITAAATALTALIAGSRTSFGLFLSPINTATARTMIDRNGLRQLPSSPAAAAASRATTESRSALSE